VRRREREADAVCACLGKALLLEAGLPLSTEYSRHWIQ
jgi:hypothetical protein